VEAFKSEKHASFMDSGKMFQIMGLKSVMNFTTDSDIDNIYECVLNTNLSNIY